MQHYDAKNQVVRFEGKFENSTKYIETMHSSQKKNSETWAVKYVLNKQS